MDPSITRPISPPKKQHILHFDGRAVMQTAKQLLANLDERIESSWEIKWLDRLIEKGNAVHDGKTCQWLYNDMVMDALGNLMPCCFEPKKAVVSVYGNIDDAGDHFNSEHYKFSREYFANQQGFRESEIGFSRVGMKNPSKVSWPT